MPTPRFIIHTYNTITVLIIKIGAYILLMANAKVIKCV